MTIIAGIDRDHDVLGAGGGREALEEGQEVDRLDCEELFALVHAFLGEERRHRHCGDLEGRRVVVRECRGEVEHVSGGQVLIELNCLRSRFDELTDSREIGARH